MKSAPWPVVHCMLFASLLTVPSIVPPLRVWPLFWIVPFALYATIVATAGPLRRTFSRPRFGNFSRSNCAVTAAIIAISVAGIFAFQHFAQPDLHSYRAAMPFDSLGGRYGAWILFPLINATLEELVYRGILFDGIASQWNQRITILATGLLFGIGHLQGYPPGPAGAALATAFGIAMGILRVRSGSIVLPIVAHIFADAAIYALLVRENLV